VRSVVYRGHVVLSSTIGFGVRIPATTSSALRVGQILSVKQVFAGGRIRVKPPRSGVIAHVSNTMTGR